MRKNRDIHRQYRRASQVIGLLVSSTLLPACGDGAPLPLEIADMSATTGTSKPDLAVPPTCSPTCAAGAPICNASHHCVVCLLDTDCPIGNVCKVVSATVSQCVKGCTSDARCGGGTMACCGMGCVDTTRSANNCGACGTVCAIPNALAACVAGKCTIGTCQPGYSDCNGDPVDGCEAAIRVDPKNCTACNKTCSYKHGQASCSDGCYLTSCDVGYDDCDNDDSNGCEAAVDSDPKNCGGCGTVCGFPSHAVGTCASSQCNLTCAAGFGDCNGLYNDGCERPLSADANNCGACGAVCPQGLICKASQCTCPNCNIPNASSKCINNVCSLDQCNAGWTDCDANANNGCEVHTDADIANCGGCGVKCPVNQTCQKGVCMMGCVSSGQRAGFNTLSATTANGCWMASPCSQDVYSWSPNNGSNFKAFGQALTCSGGATCIGNIGINTYSGSNTVCQGSWDVYCDQVLVGNLLTLGKTCAGPAFNGNCSISFNPRMCTSIQLIAVQDNDNTAGCCGSPQPDSMVTAISAW